MERYFSYSRVENRHVRLQLPERVDEHNRVVPSILACSITCASCFCTNILPDWRGHSRELQYSTIRNEGHCEVWMIMCSDDGPGWDFFFRLSQVSTMLPRKRLFVPRLRSRQPRDSSFLQSSSGQDIALKGGRNGMRG